MSAPRDRRSGSPSPVGLRDALRRLDRIAKDVPLAAFGQTPLWDEPMKAIVAASGRPMVVGIHDLDYFSRVRAAHGGPAWQIVGRDDGALKEPWIAAGELSALFGAEVWPSRQRLMQAGVRLEQLLPKSGAAREAALHRATAGWGWRGIVQQSATPSVICDVPARDVAPALLDLMRWGFRVTARSLAQRTARQEVARFARRLRAIIRRVITTRPDATLTDLYEELLRCIYEALLGGMPANLSIQHTRDFFAFNAETCSRPRFRIVECFLDPIQSPTARAAYDAAVTSSGMVTLAETGGGAVPFDVYHPSHGRGVLFVRPDRITIAFPKPLTVKLNSPVRTICELAAALDGELGPDMSLVGKAVVLPAMVGAEYAMVLTETGSEYIPRTERMLALMAEADIRLKLFPLLRVKLETWNSLQACDLGLDLPEHLAQAFGQSLISSREFARRWRATARRQGRLLERLGRILSPCELVSFLSDEKHEIWFKKLRQCMKANERLLEVQQRVDKLRYEALTTRAKEDEVRAEIKMLERQRGELNRTTLRPLKRRLDGLCGETPACERKRLSAEFEKASRRGKALLLALESKQSERRRLQAKRKAIGGKIRTIERGPGATAARRTLHSVHHAAARERLKIARNAILAQEGLDHADMRPAAWWMPAVDPEGKWFDRIRRTARFYLEPLCGCP